MQAAQQVGVQAVGAADQDVDVPDEGTGGGGGGLHQRRGRGQGCSRGEGTSEAAPEAVIQAVGGGCRSGWGRLLSVTNAIEAGAGR